MGQSAFCCSEDKKERQEQDQEKGYKSSLFDSRNDEILQATTENSSLLAKQEYKARKSDLEAGTGMPKYFEPSGSESDTVQNQIQGLL